MHTIYPGVAGGGANAGRHYLWPECPLGPALIWRSHIQVICPPEADKHFETRVGLGSFRPGSLLTPPTTDPLFSPVSRKHSKKRIIQREFIYTPNQEIILNNKTQ